MNFPKPLPGRWKNFKIDPPYAWTTEYDSGLESDPDWGFIAYRYLYRPYLNGKIFISEHPSPFKDGAFEAYRSHMVTSPYPEDQIEVLAWISLEDTNKLLREAYELP